MRYGLIANGKIENVIESDTAPGAPWVPCGDAGPGWLHSGGVFTQPEPKVQTYRHLSKLGFRNRFTPMEKARMEMAAVDNPAATMNDRMFSALMRTTLADQRDATYIDPMRLDTREGVISMESAGLLDAPGRALQILDAPITEVEAFKG